MNSHAANTLKTNPNVYEKDVIAENRLRHFVGTLSINNVDEVITLPPYPIPINMRKIA